MNFKVSAYANRVAGLNCYTVEQQGSVKKSSVYKFVGDNIKENALNCIYKGLKAVSPMVHHEDIVVVEVQNQHLRDWLSGYQEYEGYNNILDQVFEVLESIDCKYRFMFVKEPHAKVFAAKNGLSKIEYSTVDFMEDLEDG